jgi:ATP-dependent RNA helicase SUPV3L1/SUV3
MYRNIRYVINSLIESNNGRINVSNKTFLANRFFRISQSQSNRGKKTNPTLTSLFKPVEIKLTQDDIDVGAEITGIKVDKNEITKVLNKFSQRKEVRMLCMENGLDSKHN